MTTNLNERIGAFDRPRRTMTMQRRHFELIAEIIRDFDFASSEERRWFAQHTVWRLRATNPNFNEARFLRACGVDN